MRRLLDAFASMKLAVVGMTLLFMLVTACTLAQVRLGIHGAVEAYIRTFLVWVRIPGTGASIPVFPGGGLVGSLLIVNMTASLVSRYLGGKLRAGLAITHIGVILLVAGEFQTAFLARETYMSIEEGSTRNYTESSRSFELAVEEGGKPVSTVPDEALARGGELALPGVAAGMKVLEYHPNAHVVMRKDKEPGSPASTEGAGRGLRLMPHPPVTSGDESDSPAAVIEVTAGGRAPGTWLVSAALGPQELRAAGRKLSVHLRPRRTPLPFTITLKDFTHDVYPGTDIPRNFSSLVRLVDPDLREDRDVLIWMNHPLRHRGLTFYQASYGKGDTLSVLQVVRNPGWTLPYLACILVALGLAWHFGAKLLRREEEP